MEAGDGIEPSHGAFAEPGLTTWLPRHQSPLIGRDYA